MSEGIGQSSPPDLFIMNSSAPIKKKNGQRPQDGKMKQGKPTNLKSIRNTFLHRKQKYTSWWNNNHQHDHLGRNTTFLSRIQRKTPSPPPSLLSSLHPSPPPSLPPSFPLSPNMSKENGLPSSPIKKNITIGDLNITNMIKGVGPLSSPSKAKGKRKSQLLVSRPPT
jgi:hypothetical protein